MVSGGVGFEIHNKMNDASIQEQILSLAWII